MSAPADFLAPSALSMASKNILSNIPSNCGSAESDIPVTVVFKVYGRRSIVDASLQAVQIPEISCVKDCTYNEGFPAGSPSIWDPSPFDIMLHSCQNKGWEQLWSRCCVQCMSFYKILMLVWARLWGCLGGDQPPQNKNGGEHKICPDSWTLGFLGERHDW
jgi:hypothetical protein